MTAWVTLATSQTCLRQPTMLWCVQESDIFLMSPPTTTTTTDSPLLLPALRLFIPPLRLVSAAMWHVVQRGSVQDYGMVEEFVSTVSEVVPELLNADQKAQLLLGLRSRVGAPPASAFRTMSPLLEIRDVKIELC